MSKHRIQENQVVEFRCDIERRLREQVREAIEVVLEEELNEALGCRRHQRVERRRGYRNGRERRLVTTVLRGAGAGDTLRTAVRGGGRRPGIRDTSISELTLQSCLLHEKMFFILVRKGSNLSME